MLCCCYSRDFTALEAVLSMLKNESKEDLESWGLHWFGAIHDLVVLLMKKL